MPVYNWDVSVLLAKLTAEIRQKKLHDQIELIVIDDCSTDQGIKHNNADFAEKYGQGVIQYFELNNNIGRAAVRNLLAQKASGDYLLFLDSDTLPDSDDYIAQYLSYALQNECDVVCGGISYLKRTLNGAEYDFYIYMGKKLVAQATKFRHKTPWRYLWTSNVLILKSVLSEIPFNEGFGKYGYEDAEWAIRLVKKYKVVFIENTVSHLGLDSKEVAYRKMRESINNYFLLATMHPKDFRRSGIFGVVRWLTRLNTTFLKSIDRLLQMLFFRIANEKICFFIYQFNKAVLLARQLKD